MKRTWMAMAAVLSATAIFATGARADDPPVVEDASRVAYYLELDGMDAAKVRDLAALLKREFPKAHVDLIDGTLRIQADGATFGGIKKVLAAHELGEAFSEGMKLEVLHERALEGKTDERAAKEARPLVKMKVGELREARLVLKGGDPKPGPDLGELKKRIHEALQAGRIEEAQELAVAFMHAQEEGAKETSGKAHLDLGPEALEALRERLERIKARLAGDMTVGERLELERTRRRLEEVEARLEEVGDVLARGGGAGGAGGRPRPPVDPMPPVPPMPPRRADVGGFHEPRLQGREGKEGRGPLAEFRERIRHLQQAAEHLNAAGYEGLAKKAGEAAEQVKRQAEEAAKRHRAEEEARAAAMRKEHEARATQHDQARAEARKREEALRAAGMLAPPDSSELRAEELLDLLRALNRQMNAMREEFKAFREQVARDRPAPR